jgi:hypothetical protein
MDLSAFALNCSLKSAGEASSTDKLIDEVFVALESHGCGVQAPDSGAAWSEGGANDRV